MEGRCNNQLASAEEKLKEATDTETGLMSQIQALTSQKKVPVNCMVVQWNLRTRDTLGATILSLVENVLSIQWNL